jgi:O-antigen/teichoic acid export membrane protein
MTRRAFYWSAIGQIVVFLVTFGGSVIVARLLTPHEMGIYAISLATIGVLQVVTAFGVGNYVIRAEHLDQRTVDSAFTINALIAAVLSATIYAFSYAGARFLSDPAVADVLHILSLLPLLSILDFRPSTLLQREMDFRSVSIATVAATIVGTVTTVILAYFGASYLSQAYGGVLGALANTVGLSLLGRRHLSFRVSTGHWREMIGFGLRMMSIGGVSALASRMSDIILGRMLGLANLGLFSRASNLNMMIFTNVQGTLTRIIFVKLSHDYRQFGVLRAPFLKWVSVVSGVMGPILMGLAVLSRPVIVILYGERWLAAALPLSLLLTAQFVTLRYAMNWEAFVIKDELNKQTVFEVSRSLFSVCTRMIGCLIGLVGAAAAAIVDAVFSVLLYGRQVDRLIEAQPGDMGRVTADTLIVTFAAIGPSLALMIWTGWDPHTPILWLALAIACGIALWLFALAKRAHPLMNEILVVIASVREGWRRLARRRA